MQLNYDLYGKHEQPVAYLTTPSRIFLCAINGIDISTVNYEGVCNDVSSITFDVSQYIETDDGKMIESTAYNWFSKYMKIYISSLGWFIMDSPETHGSGTKEYKSITANSAQGEYGQIPLDGWKVNCGTTDSLEMLVDGNVEEIEGVEFAKQQIKFFNEKTPQLSLIDILVSKVPGWKIGHVDNIPKEYETIENGEIKKKLVYLKDEIGTFDISYSDVYSFLTQDFEKFFSCIVEFDYKNLVVNFYRVENFGKDTNITIGYRNVQNSNDITIDDEHVYTKYRVSGADDLGIEQVNGGNNNLFYIDPFWLNNKYLSTPTIEKYKAWFSFCEKSRIEYTKMSKQWNELQDKITEFYIRIPTGDCDPDNWHKLSDEALTALKKDYEAQKLGYEKIYVDSEGNFDINALNASPDANIYHQIVDTILPNIKIEFDNRKLPTSEGAMDFIEDYETTWEYYGINELEVKLASYKDQANLLSKSHYDLTWERYQELSKQDSKKYPPLTEDGFKDKHEIYAKNAYQLDEKNTDSCAAALKKRRDEAKTEEEKQKELGKRRTELGQRMSLETWSDEKLGNFEKEELAELYHITKPTTYTNENIFVSSQDSLTDIVTVQQQLCRVAMEELMASSVPQTIYSTDVDNLLSATGSELHARTLDLGNFIWLGIRDDYFVKLRVMTISFNPFLFDNNFSITFSNMIKSRSKRNDFISILGSGSNLGGSGARNNYVGNLQLTDDNIYQILQKILQSSSFTNKVQNIVNGSGGSIIGGTGGNYITPGTLEAEMIKCINIEAENGFFQYLQSELISAGKIVAESGDFKSLSASVAQIDNLLAGNVSAELGHIINLTAKNVRIDEAVIKDLIAAQITVSMLKAGTISADKFKIESDDGGMAISGNTMQFKDKNNVVRIQIGRDSNNDFTFCLYDETGKGVLIDSTGIKESAIGDGLIKTDMVANGAITESKIDKTGIREWTDTDGSKIFDVGKMYFGDDKFEVSYSQTLEKVSTLEEKVGSIELMGEQIFKDKNGEVLPSAITVKAVCRNGITVGKWYIDNIQNTEFVSSDNMSITIPSAYMSEKNTITIKVEDSTGNLYDLHSLYFLKSSEGTPGKDAYTIILENENVSFPVSINNIALSDESFTSSVMVMQGVEKREDFTIGDVVSENGIDISKQGSIITLSVKKGAKILANSGSFKIPIIVDGITFTKTISWSVSKQGVTGDAPINIVVGNESQSIPCTSAGIVSKQMLLEIPFAGYEGFTKIACEVSVGELPPGVSHASENATPETDGKVVLNIAKNATLGGSDILNGVINLTFTIKGQTVVKQFSWSKTKDGADGSARAYMLQPSTLIVKKLSGNTFSPETVTFSSFYKDGNSASTNEYSGRFIIERSINGTTFETVYTSSKDETVSIYKVQKDDAAIRCTLCASGGITDKLDFQTVTILNDGSNVNSGGVNLAEETNRGDKNWKWNMETGDYTASVEEFQKISCVKLTRGTLDQTGWSYILYSKIMPEKYNPDEDYMISFDVKSNVSTTINAYLCDENGVKNTNDLGDTYTAIKNEIAKDEWKHCIFQVRTKKDIPNTRQQVLYLTDMDSNPNTYYIFKNLQIERGSIATDWKPAPEDTKNDMSSLEETLITKMDLEVDNLNKKITAKVDQSKFNEYVGENGEVITGITDKVNDVQIGLDGINTKVSEVQSTLDKKADGTTVQTLSQEFSEFKQSTEGFQQTVVKDYVTKSGLSDELKKQAVFVISLTNDNHIIPTDSTGENSNYDGCETTVTAIWGSENVTENCVFTQSASPGITGTWNKKTFTYTVTNMTEDSGYVDITGTYSMIINDKQETRSDTKRFVLSKRKDAESTIVYTLQSSDTIVKMLTENTFDPKTITFSSFYRDGNSSQKKFNGAFQILESINGGSFIEKYFSETKQSEVIYTPKTKGLTKIQCILYKELDKTDELDRYTINVIYDQTVDIGCRNLIRNSKNLIFSGYGLIKSENISYITDEMGNRLTDELGNKFIF